MPEKALPGAGATWGEQIRGIGQIMARPLFWRIVLPFVITHGAYQALQGLWLGPWLTDVAGFAREGAARLLLVCAAAYAIGSVAFGSFADRLAARGFSRLALYKAGLLDLVRRVRRDRARTPRSRARRSWRPTASPSCRARSSSR